MMINSVSLIDGSVFEIPLLKKYGYAYIKLVSPPVTGTNCILVEVFDFYRKEPVSCEFEVSFFDNIGLSMPHLLLIEASIVQQNDARWRLIGSIDVPEDYAIPDFVWCSNMTLGKPERFALYSWHIVPALGTMPRILASYESCKNLGFFNFLSWDLIVARITMEFMKQNGVDISDFFTNEDFKKPWYNTLYNQTIYFGSNSR